MTKEQMTKFEGLEIDRKRCEFFCFFGLVLAICGGAYSPLFLIIGILLVWYWDVQRREIIENNEYRTLRLYNAYERDLNK